MQGQWRGLTAGDALPHAGPLRAGLQQEGCQSDDALREEACALAAHVCLRKLRKLQLTLPTSLPVPPALQLLLAAHAVRACSSKHAHSMLAAVSAACLTVAH